MGTCAVAVHPRVVREQWLHSVEGQDIVPLTRRQLLLQRCRRQAQTGRRQQRQQRGVAEDTPRRCLTRVKCHQRLLSLKAPQNHASCSKVFSKVTKLLKKLRNSFKRGEQKGAPSMRSQQRAATQPQRGKFGSWTFRVGTLSPHPLRPTVRTHHLQHEEEEDDTCVRHDWLASI